MENEIKTTYEKVESTNPKFDNSHIVAKIPYVHTDDFGNTKPPFFRKEIINQEALVKEKERLETQLAETIKTIEDVSKISAKENLEQESINN